jgi:tight adherence protein C
MDPLSALLLIGAVIAFFVGVAIVISTIAAASIGRAGVSRGLDTIDTVYGAGGPASGRAGVRARGRGGSRAAGRGADSRGAVSPVTNRMTQLGRAATRGQALTRLQRWIDYAGNPPYWTVDRVFEIKGLGLIVLGLFGAVVGLVVDWGAGAAVGGVLGAALGFYVPDMVVYDLGYRRQEKILRALPDILDTLTVSVEAGLGFDAALAQITRYARGPLAGEFARALQEMQIGRSRVDALRAMGQRTSIVELRSFCAIVVQATELGVPIANVLREQSKEMRIRRRQRAEELAQKVPVKILFPLIFCLFPALFIVVLGPGLINILTIFGH